MSFNYKTYTRIQNAELTKLGLTIKFTVVNLEWDVFEGFVVQSLNKASVDRPKLIEVSLFEPEPEFIVVALLQIGHHLAAMPQGVRFFHTHYEVRLQTFQRRAVAEIQISPLETIS